VLENWTTREVEASASVENACFQSESPEERSPPAAGRVSRLLRTDSEVAADFPRLDDRGGDIGPFVLSGDPGPLLRTNRDHL